MNGNLSVEERIKRCLLIEKMNQRTDYCEQLGLKNKSILYGLTKPVNLWMNDPKNEKDII